MDWTDLRTHLAHLAISLGAVIALAILQYLTNLLAAQHPELVAGAAQTASAFTAIKLLGR